MSDNTYSSKPFISYDAPDENKHRAEVRVITGFGHVADIIKSKKGKARNIAFEVSNTEHQPKAWVQADSKVMEKVEQAQAAGEPIHFRIEIRRRDHIDRKTPMSEVSPPGDMNAARDNIYRSLAAVKLADDADWEIDPNAKTRLDEDPSTGSGNSAYSWSLEDLQKLKGGNTSSNTGNSGGGNYSGHPVESTPYHTFNRNGELNPGSIAASVPMNFYNFVAEWDRNHDDVSITEKQRAVIARRMLQVANKMQVAIYNGELDAPDLSLGSHTRARAIVFEVIRNFYPLTTEVASDKEQLREWSEAIYKKGLGMWQWSIREVNSLFATDGDTD